jgi:hypothetical protein
MYMIRMFSGTKPGSIESNPCHSGDGERKQQDAPIDVRMGHAQDAPSNGCGINRVMTLTPQTASSNPATPPAIAKVTLSARS